MKLSALGVIFNTDLEMIVSKNSDKAFSKMNGIITLWGKRNLTCLGPITVVKSLYILPCFITIFCLSHPSQIIFCLILICCFPVYFRITNWIELVLIRLVSFILGWGGVVWGSQDGGLLYSLYFFESFYFVVQKPRQCPCWYTLV